MGGGVSPAHVPCSHASARGVTGTWWLGVRLCFAWQSERLSWHVLRAKKILSQLLITRATCTHRAEGLGSTDDTQLKDVSRGNSCVGDPSRNFLCPRNPLSNVLLFKNNSFVEIHNSHTVTFSPLKRTFSWFLG